MKNRVKDCWFSFLIPVKRLGIKKIKINRVAYLYSKAIYFPGTALFDAMAVLAMLKISNRSNYPHLHAPAQPIMPPPKPRAA